MLDIMEGKVGKVNLPMKSSLDRWSLSQTVTSRVCPAKSCVMVLSKQQHKKNMLRKKEEFIDNIDSICLNYQKFQMCEGELPNAMFGEKKTDWTPKTKESTL